MNCEACSKEILSTNGVAYQISGWEKERKGGGTNHVLWRERTGRVMCPTCVVKKVHGVTSEQMTLA